MSLLVEIQSAAIDPKSDLGTILRKCKVLAARLDSAPLEEWLLWESNGYPDDVAVPDYRKWPLQLKGHFSGPFQSGIRNAPIPIVCLPKDIREAYENYECRQSVAALEELAKTSEGTLTLSTGDLNVVLGMKVYQGQNCIQAWAEVGKGNIIEVLNTVRNRVLDFALALWKKSPTAGDLNDDARDRIQPGQVTQIFHTTVYEGGAATVVGTAQNSSVNTIVQNDFASLRRYLEEQGVNAEDVKGLHTALLEDKKPASQEALGPKVSSWIGKMVGKAAAGTWKIGAGVAAKILTDAILRHYGFSS